MNGILPHDHCPPMEAELSRTPGTEAFLAAARFFRLLDDPVRVRIFWILCHCEECVTNLSAMTEMSSPAVSHHLRLLNAAGLISRRRAGKEVYYRSAATPGAELLHRMIEDLIELTCPRT